MEALPRQTSIFDAVYVAIRDSICDGELAPGQRITQDELADRLGVSRQPVSQALIVLKSQGFVSETGRRGVVVAPLRIDMVRDIYEMRGALDELAARLAAARARPEALAEGRDILAAGQRLVVAGAVKDLVKADMAFHEWIYRLSGNALIRQALDAQWHHLRRVMAAVIGHGDYREVLWGEHENILNGIAEGDAEAAGTLSRRHVEAASVTLRERLQADRSLEVVS
jgi:DNA-binding GntR family transcriptional regulator